MEPKTDKQKNEEKKIRIICVLPLSPSPLSVHVKRGGKREIILVLSSTVQTLF
jgi:hypothetical protein